MITRAITIVIPSRNESENLTVLLDEVDSAMNGRDYEVIVVDDGSTDSTAAILHERIKAGRCLRHIRHDKSAGQSAAVRTGVLAAKGEIVVTMDGDGQNDPVYIPRLVDALISAGPGVGIAAGQRSKRTDSRLKQLASKFANGLREAILKDKTHDSGCGLKAVYTKLFRELPFFDGWHRFLPALVMREGLGIIHIEVVDRPRLNGQSNYGVLDRGARGIVDLCGVWWLKRRRRTLPDITESHYELVPFDTPEAYELSSGENSVNISAAG
ncbi:glycosyltransferase family 2 protein [Phyllobacterium sp. SB3]|uniref:glycosyltransferase family 2 protein n=1 Tax=Phyllobacterium sp. SB3 TaxID=3156073 RepID=UPI0032AF92A4